VNVQMNYPDVFDVMFKTVFTLVFFNLIVLRNVAFSASFLI